MDKQLLEGYITDLISDFLYYDRKEDDDLPCGAIEKAIKDGEITIDDICNMFRKEIEEGLAE